MNQKTNKNMTALISAFSRAYHTKENKETIYQDHYAEKLLTAEEYAQISFHMSQGIGFFNPQFNGTEKEALKWIVNHQLSPSPLGRAKYTEEILKQAVSSGSTQYILLGSGYDTFACNQYDWMSPLTIFELDREDLLKDKEQRLLNAGISSSAHFVPVDFEADDWMDKLIHHPHFNLKADSVLSLLGVSYYLKEEDFVRLLQTIATSVKGEMRLIFDYPDENTYSENADERTKKQLLMTSAAGEKMLSCYSLSEMEHLLHASGFEVVEQLTPDRIMDTLFKHYNDIHSTEPIMAFNTVNYCHAWKRGSL